MVIPVSGSHTTKIHGGVDVYLHAFLTEAVHECEWSPTTGEELNYPLHRKLGVPQVLSGRGGEENRTLVV